MVVSEDQNLIEHDGLFFVRDAVGTCKECDLLKYELCHEVPCQESERNDKESIFVELNKTESNPVKMDKSDKKLLWSIFVLELLSIMFLITLTIRLGGC